jgi:hypothetical protein
MQFADVILRTRDLGDSVNTLNLCQKKFADNPYVSIRFRKDNGYKFSSNGIVAEKLHDTWACLVSTISFDKPISYFEIEILQGGSYGIFVGITNAAAQMLMHHGILEFNSSVIYNGDGHNTVLVYNVGSEKMLTGDVIGVVVDRERDVTRFYVNGEFVFAAWTKPSYFDKIYAIVGSKHKHTKFRVCKRYPYHSLDIIVGYYPYRDFK